MNICESLLLHVLYFILYRFRLVLVKLPQVVTWGLLNAVSLPLCQTICYRCLLPGTFVQSSKSSTVLCFPTPDYLA